MAKLQGLWKTEDSSWYAVKNIMNIKNIDDYRKIVIRCPNIKSYLQIHRTDQRFNSKMTYKILKPVPVITTKRAATLESSSCEPGQDPRILHLTKPKGPRPGNPKEPEDVMHTYLHR